jgi:hypothetical protein
MSTAAQTRPPLPPFNRESAIEKVRLAEDGWNSRDPERVSLAYTLDTQWRNRAEFANNREEAKGLSDPQMGQGAGLPVDQGTLGLFGQPHRRALRL